MTALRGILLDIDGTLIDSNDHHAHAWVDTLEHFGMRGNYAKIRDLIGMGGDKLLPEVSGIEKDTPKGKEISEYRSRVFKEKYLSKIRAFPRTRDLVERLRGDELMIVVATSAAKDELQGLLKAARVDDLIEEKATATDAENSKPDPDIIEAALQRSGLKAHETIMLGDTPYDIEAATKAGVAVIALRSGGWGDDDLAGAIAIYDDPEDLLAHYVDSPIWKRLNATGSSSR
jgi:HAD superfamily hydrolase (TIGR01509 family)